MNTHYNMLGFLSHSSCGTAVSMRGSARNLPRTHMTSSHRSVAAIGPPTNVPINPYIHTVAGSKVAAAAIIVGI